MGSTRHEVWNEVLAVLPATVTQVADARGVRREAAHRTLWRMLEAGVVTRDRMPVPGRRWAWRYEAVTPAAEPPADGIIDDPRASGDGPDPRVREWFERVLAERVDAAGSAEPPDPRVDDDTEDRDEYADLAFRLRALELSAQVRAADVARLSESVARLRREWAADSRRQTWALAAVAAVALVALCAVTLWGAA